ncbi:hypothetical protein NBRC116597_25230 [Phaeobacter sp. NW0010-22]
MHSLDPTYSGVCARTGAEIRANTILRHRNIVAKILEEHVLKNGKWKEKEYLT